MKFKNKKGQLSFINIFTFMVIVVISAVLTPFMNSIIQDAIANGNYSDMTQLVMQAVIPLFWVGVIMTFFIYLTPIRPNQY